MGYPEGNEYARYLEKRIKKVLVYLDACESFGDEPDIDDIRTFLKSDLP